MNRRLGLTIALLFLAALAGLPALAVPDESPVAAVETTVAAEIPLAVEPPAEPTALDAPAAVETPATPEPPAAAEPASEGPPRAGLNYWAALDDPQGGSLYPAVARLLNATRTLPSQLDLARMVPPVIPEEAEAPDGEAAGPQPVADPHASQAESGWVRVLDQPVVSDQELAYTYLRAGQYEEAAAMYGALSQQAPDDQCLLAMCVLCERNAGREKGTAEALARLQAKGGEAGEWAAWLGEMIELGGPLRQEAGVAPAGEQAAPVAEGTR